MKSKEKVKWEQISKDLKNNNYFLGRHWTYNYYNDPKRLGFVLSRYKFASKMIGDNKSILELGSSEGIGACILADNKNKYLGIDLDEESIETAKKNYSDYCEIQFLYDDFLNKSYGKFDSIVSLDVIEHISKRKEKDFFETIYDNLTDNGFCIIGTPNITSSQHASTASQIGHINLFSQKRLIENLQVYFHQVLPFGMNDEILHTGFSSMSHYLFCIGCHKRERQI